MLDGLEVIKFFLDDPDMEDHAFQKEKRAPYDFAGTSIIIAKSFDSAGLRNGYHTITAEIELSHDETIVVRSTFAVDN